MQDTKDSDLNKIIPSSKIHASSYPVSETEEIQVSSLISVASSADKHPCISEVENETPEIPIPMEMEVYDPSDPATYTGKLTEHEINLALRLEEFKLHDSFVFPSVNNRKYSPKWRYCKLPDGPCESGSG